VSYLRRWAGDGIWRLLVMADGKHGGGLDEELKIVVIL
jgi:hypothetical protein